MTGSSSSKAEVPPTPWATEPAQGVRPLEQISPPHTLSARGPALGARLHGWGVDPRLEGANNNSGGRKRKTIKELNKGQTLVPMSWYKVLILRQ